jgi:hypothetical protein
MFGMSMAQGQNQCQDKAENKQNFDESQSTAITKS